MRQLTVHLNDKELAQLEATARARHIDPTRMTRTQLLKVLRAQNTKWRTGLNLRRNLATGKWVEVVPAKRTLAHARLAEKRPEKNVPAPAVVLSPTLSPADAARAKRLAAIMSVHGLWKNDPDKPQDAIAYQQEARAEWR